MQDLAELASLGLTVPTVVLSFMVVSLFGGPAIKAARIKPADRTAVQWFSLGVAIGFAGSVVDNFFWAIAWAAAYTESPTAASLFSNGVYLNIPFRQLAGITAAYCHCRCAIKYIEGEPCRTDLARLDSILYASLAGGLTLVAAMLAIRLPEL